jgi:U3 small nucleolar RNA-associated protein 23
MRVNRAKQVRKHLKFYKIVCGINLPYNVILDSNFIYAALKYKLDIRERVNKTLQIPGGESATFYVTKSALDELQSLGGKGAEALEFAQSYCSIIQDTEFAKEELAHDKLVTFLENMQLNPTDHRSRSYFVASQDKDLRSIVNSRVAGVPLIYLNKVSVVLEPPSAASRNFKKRVENSKSTISAAEQTIVDEIKTHDTKREEARQAKALLAIKLERVKKKATAANPMACKKADTSSKTSKKKKADKFRGGK